MGSPLQICTPQHFPLLVWQHLFICIDFVQFLRFLKSTLPEEFFFYRSFKIVGIILYPDPDSNIFEKESEPVFLNVYGAQESIPRNKFRQPM
jgi:hypothetical protein